MVETMGSESWVKFSALLYTRSVVLLNFFGPQFPHS